MTSEDIKKIQERLKNYSIDIDKLQDTSLQKLREQLRTIISENLEKIRNGKEKRNLKKDKNIESESASYQTMKKCYDELKGKQPFEFIPWKEFEKIEQASEQENNEEPTLD